MKLGKIEIVYCPPRKTARQIAEDEYKAAKKEMAKLTIKELNGIIAGASFIMLSMLNEVHAAVNLVEMEAKLNARGNEMLAIIQLFGYWAALIFAAIDIVKAFKKQDMAGLVGIAAKYAVAVGILYGLPDIFDIFKDLFS